jgi:hypothetical protein
MINSTYTGSFATGSLLHKETNAILPLLLLEQSDNFIKQEIQQNNLLKITAVRKFL